MSDATNGTESLEFLFENPKADRQKLEEMTSLKQLSFIHHNISSYDFFHSLKNIEKMWVLECDISDFSPFLSIPKLKYLNVSYNNISSFPTQTLEKLEELNISFNKISSWNGISSLKAIKKLNICCNKFTSIHPQILSCNELQSLSAAGNLISHFSDIDVLVGLPSLTEVSFSDVDYGDNPICKMTNYHTNALFKLPHVENLDGNVVSPQTRETAFEMFHQKGMFYGMECSTLNRQVTSSLRALREAFDEVSEEVQCEILALLQGAADTYVNGLTSSESRLQKRAEDRLAVHEFLGLIRDFWTSEIFKSQDRIISRFAMELKLGGNVKFECCTKRAVKILQQIEDGNDSFSSSSSSEEDDDSDDKNNNKIMDDKNEETFSACKVLASLIQRDLPLIRHQISSCGNPLYSNLPIHSIGVASMTQVHNNILRSNFEETQVQAELNKTNTTNATALFRKRMETKNHLQTNPLPVALLLSSDVCGSSYLNGSVAIQATFGASSVVSSQESTSVHFEGASVKNDLKWTDQLVSIVSPAVKDTFESLFSGHYASLSPTSIVQMLQKLRSGENLVIRVPLLIWSGIPSFLESEHQMCESPFNPNNGVKSAHTFYSTANENAVCPEFIVELGVVIGYGDNLEPLNADDQEIPSLLLKSTAAFNADSNSRGKGSYDQNDQKGDSDSSLNGSDSLDWTIVCEPISVGRSHSRYSALPGWKKPESLQSIIDPSGTAASNLSSYPALETQPLNLSPVKVFETGPFKGILAEAMDSLRAGIWDLREVDGIHLGACPCCLSGKEKEEESDKKSLPIPVFVNTISGGVLTGSSSLSSSTTSAFVATSKPLITLTTEITGTLLTKDALKMNGRHIRRIDAAVWKIPKEDACWVSVDLSSNHFDCLGSLFANYNLNNDDSVIPTVTKLNLSFNCIQNLWGASRINKVFPNLLEIDLSFNMIPALDSLLTFVSDLPHLTNLNIRGNPIRHHSSNQILSLYEIANALRSVSISLKQLNGIPLDAIMQSNANIRIDSDIVDFSRPKSILTPQGNVLSDKTLASRAGFITSALTNSILSTTSSSSLMTSFATNSLMSSTAISLSELRIFSSSMQEAQEIILKQQKMNKKKLYPSNLDKYSTTNENKFEDDFQESDEDDEINCDPSEVITKAWLLFKKAIFPSSTDRAVTFLQRRFGVLNEKEWLATILFHLRRTSQRIPSGDFKSKFCAGQTVDDPDTPFWLSALSILDLSGLGLESLPVSALSCMKNLSVLIASDNNFSELKNIAVLCPNLKQITVSNNKLFSLSDLVENNGMQLLAWLDASCNLIDDTRMPSSFSKLPLLRYVNLSDNNLETVDILSTIPSIRALSLANNSIDEIRSIMGLKSCNELSMLDLSGNPIIGAPTYREYAIFHLSDSLKMLDGAPLCFAQAVAASERFSGKVSLELLESQLGASACYSFRKIALENLKLKDLGGLLSEEFFPALKELSLENNLLTSISTLGSLPNLLELNLARNKLGLSLSWNSGSAFGMPHESSQSSDEQQKQLSQKLGTGLALVPNLQELDLRKNGIPNLRCFSLSSLNFICLSQSLKVLNLSQNDIVRVEGLNRFQSLRDLNLAQNKIRAIEVGAFLGLVNLKTLDLSDNGIKQLSPWMSAGCLPKLKVLNLTTNRIADASEISRLSHLESLTSIKLVHNPIARRPIYRGSLIRSKPQLVLIDGHEISSDEKTKFLGVFEQSAMFISSTVSAAVHYNSGNSHSSIGQQYPINPTPPNAYPFANIQQQQQHAAVLASLIPSVHSASLATVPNGPSVVSSVTNALQGTVRSNATNRAVNGIISSTFSPSNALSLSNSSTGSKPSFLPQSTTPVVLSASRYGKRSSSVTGSNSGGTSSQMSFHHAYGSAQYSTPLSAAGAGFISSSATLSVSGAKVVTGNVTPFSQYQSQMGKRTILTKNGGSDASGQLSAGGALFGVGLVAKPLAPTGNYNN